ncbi:hypothetical protein OGAPHI_005867 [Ogataea philodendri]|uniref:SCD domain-containing protein n=1 Tax=Ogataea philodendri TaxID=1378263 RepID=A0A9P8T255_9ASCO|nr:uncharacterized protein OGAPHI_005867 [Ogataea philodendri]KAH3662615.1 hypothetical protein OGAPHI_005867 [Ogataea philodendri]
MSTRRSSRLQNQPDKSHNYSVDLSESEGNDSDQSEHEYQPTKRGSRKPTKSQRAPKRRKTVPNNIDQLENFQENYLFEALSNAESAVAELAASWLDQFQEDKYDAIKDMVNLVLRSCGCVTLVAQHDVVNADSSKETIAEIQAMFEKQVSHEYPLGLASNSKNPNWKDYKKRCLEFIDQVLVTANEQGVIFEDEELIELLLTWFGAITTSNARPLRYSATVLCLQMETTLCSLMAQISNSISRTQRQLNNEQRNIDSLAKKARSEAKLAAAKERASQIEQNVQLYMEHKNYLETFLQDIFNTTFAHRYRDTDSQIRQECVRQLSNWIDQYPEFFFESVYIRYLGWLMTDQESAVRNEVLRVLLKLYQSHSAATALRQFTSHFKDKLMEIAFYETDLKVRSSCIQVLTEITRMGFLETEEVVKLSSLIFVDNEDSLFPKSKSAGRLYKELSKLIAVAESETFTQYLESNGATVDKVDESMDLDVKQLLKFHGLSQLLVEAEAYYVENILSSQPKKSSDNARAAKLSNISQNLYAVPRYHGNSSLEVLCNYLTLDVSSNPELDKIKENIELSYVQTEFVLSLVTAATTIYCEAEANEFHLQIFPKKQEDATGEKTLILGKLVAQLSGLFELCKKSHLSAFLALFNQITKHNICETLDQTETETKISKQLIKSFRESSLQSFSPDSSDYYNSTNYQFFQFFQYFKLDIMEISLEFDKILKELGKELSLGLKNVDYAQTSATLNKLMLLKAPATKFRLLTELGLQIDHICSSLGSLPISEELNDLTASNRLVEYFSCILFFVSENLEILTNKLKVDPDTDALDELHHHLLVLAPIKRVLVELVGKDSLDIAFWYEVTSVYLDVFTTLNVLKYYVGSHRDVLEHFFDTEMAVEPLSGTQEHLLRLFLVLEAEVALEKDVQLDRTESEDVAFERLKLPDAERKLCTLTAKLVLLDKTVGLQSFLMSRVKLNRAVLGDLFNQVLDYQQPEIKEETETPHEKSRTQSPAPQQEQSDQFLHTNTSVPDLLPEPLPDLVL